MPPLYGSAEDKYRTLLDALRARLKNKLFILSFIVLSGKFCFSPNLHSFFKVFLSSSVEQL